MRADIIFLLLNAIDLTQSFSVQCNQGTKRTFKANNGEISRRKSMQKLITPIISSALVNTVSPPAVFAKEKEPSTPQALSDAFNKVKNELTSSSGGMSILTTMINNKEWENVKEFTKNYDLEFRKAMMGSARKLIPKDNNKQLRADATQMCNNVTFDLIAVNKASRVEDIDAAIKALGILKNDISEFLDLESKVVWE